MKTIVLILIVILKFGILANSNETHTQTVRGTVKDAVTGYPLPGAHVIVSGLQPLVATTTDANGQFTLPKVPIGRQSITITFMGYAPGFVNNLLLTTGKESFIEVKLEEMSQNIGEIAVKAAIRKERPLNDMALVSARAFTVEETERYAGSLGDPARMVANYAGVMTQNDSRNDIIIRGNSPSGVLWRMEGVEIPNPNHFGVLGTTGGPVSMVNNNLLANSDFITGAFPAEFGNVMSGVFDLNLRSGNANLPEFIGQIGFNGFEAGAEGPLFKTGSGQKASYLANFRYSTLEVMNKIGFSVGTGTAVPQYKDLTFIADIPGTKAGRFKLFGLFGKSFIDLGRDLSDTIENQYNFRGTATDFGSGLSVTGLSHTYFFNESTRIKSTLSWQKTTSDAILDSVVNKTFKPFYRGNQAESKFAVSTQVRYKASPKTNYLFGLIADHYSMNYLDSAMSRKFGKFITLTDIEGQLVVARIYGQWQHRFTPNLNATAGLNLLYLNLNSQFAPEPRVALLWQPNTKHTFTAGFGVHSQMHPREVYFYQTYNPETGGYSLTNKNLKMGKSLHYIAGYQFVPANHLRIKGEIYYQSLLKIPVIESHSEFSMINSGDQFGIPKVDSLLNLGKGRNYGTELTVEKFLHNGWYILYTASLFDSKYTGYDGIWRNTAFNGNYVFNLLGGYEVKLGKNSRLTVDLKTVWAGGKRYIPVDFEASEKKREEVRDWQNSYKNRYNDYFRTDIRVGYLTNKKKYNQQFAIDLQNISGFKSIFMESYDAKRNETYKVYQQGFMPMFLYRIQF